MPTRPSDHCGRSSRQQSQAVEVQGAAARRELPQELAHKRKPPSTPSMPRFDPSKPPASLADWPVSMGVLEYPSTTEPLPGPIATVYGGRRYSAKVMP